MSRTLALLAALAATACGRAPSAPDLNAYLDLMIDVTESLDGTAGLRPKLSSYRGRADAFLADHAEHYESNALDASDPATRRLAFVYFNLLEAEGIALIHDTEHFPESVALNAMEPLAKLGYSWTPRDPPLDKAYALVILDSRGKEIATGPVGRDTGLADSTADRVWSEVTAVIRTTDVVPLPIPVLADQEYVLFARRAALERLRTRYGDRFGKIFSLDGDWAEFDPAVPPR